MDGASLKLNRHPIAEVICQPGEAPLSFLVPMGRSSLTPGLVLIYADRCASIRCCARAVRPGAVLKMISSGLNGDARPVCARVALDVLQRPVETLAPDAAGSVPSRVVPGGVTDPSPVVERREAGGAP